VSSSSGLKLAAGSNSHLNWLVSTSETDLCLQRGFYKGTFLLERSGSFDNRTLSAKGLGCGSERISLLGNKLGLSSRTEVAHSLLLDGLDLLGDLLRDGFGPESLPPVLLALTALFLAHLPLPLDARLLLLDVGRGQLLGFTRLLHTRLAALVLAPCMLVVKSTLVVPALPLPENSLLEPSWLCNLGERAN